MKPSPENPVCQKCGLYKGCLTPFMKSSGAKQPSALVIGEAPGEDEDRIGKPFVGRSGQLLRTVLEEVGFEDNDLRFTNVVRCRPPNNAAPSRQQINLCRSFALEDIARYKPEMVLLMGNTPLQGIINETGISSYNGVVIEKEFSVGETLNRHPGEMRDDDSFSVKFLPLYHPAYILRNMSMLDEWVEAINKALAGQESDKCTYIFPETIDAIQEMADYLNSYDWISYDVETSLLDAFSDASMLLSVSFAAGDRAYALPIQHPEAPWDDKEYEIIVSTIIDILYRHDRKIVGHNIKFDQMHTFSAFEYMFKAGGDTMLISHLLDSRLGIHGLKRLAGIHLGMYDYDEELRRYCQDHKEADPRRGGSYAFVPLAILLLYGAKDAWATLLLEEKLYDHLSDKQKVFYHNVVIPASDELCHTQCNGIAIDYFIAHRYLCIYNDLKVEVFEDIMRDKNVTKLSNAQGKPFNPNSHDQLATLYFKHYHMPVMAKTDTGAPSTKAEVMKPLATKYPIISKINYYKLLSKMIGTYLEPASTKEWSSGDGRVRSTYNLHGSRTGRLSSSQPVNLQNIPTPEKEPGTILETLPIKNIFTHSFWINRDKFLQAGVLMSIDYSGMELRVFSSLARCMPMIQIFKIGKDVHSCIAIMSMEHISPHQVTDQQIAKLPRPVRYRFKWTNWTLLYGGDEYTLMRLYGIPEAEAHETVVMYYKTFPEVLDYRVECTEFAEDHGYIESPFGRREKLAYINDSSQSKRNKDIRQAVNMPVQSGASDTLLIAKIIIGKELRARKMVSKIVNTVHDSLVLDVPDPEIIKASDLCVDVMENVKDWGKKYMPKIGFSWLLAPLVADVEVGSHWGTEQELKKWVKDHKDRIKMEV